MAPDKVRWSDLPPELLQTISGCLRKPTDTIRFRSVCRSWRSCAPLPPNIISPLFPLTLPYASPRNGNSGFTINATAIYLLRPRSDPSRVRMVSVQEPEAGKLLMRALLPQEDQFPAGKWLDLHSDEWISATQIARSYTHGKSCYNCERTSGSLKLAFINPNQSNDSSLGSEEFAGLCQVNDDCYRLSFRRDDNTTRTHSLGSDIVDIVSFKRKIYVVDCDCCFYELVRGGMLLARWNCENFGYHSSDRWKNFVVSDGDLYAVLRSWRDDHPECFRLVLRERKWERVRDLGDRVLFIADGCSFSVSARDLPSPWKGNCIVIADSLCAFCAMSERSQRINVFQLEGDDRSDPQFRWVSSLQGYLDLFDLPNS